MCICIAFLSVFWTVPARASDEYVVVEWANADASRSFAKKCAISLEPLPVSPGAKRKAQRLTVEQLEQCPGLIRKLPSSSGYRESVKTMFNRLSETASTIQLIRAGTPKTPERVSFKQLSSQADQVEFYEFPWGVLKPHATRRGFVFLTGSKKVIVNSLNPAALDQEKRNIKDGKFAALLVHEVLQAMGGYYDGYYEFSTALWLLAKADKKSLPSLLEQIQLMSDRLLTKKIQIAAKQGGCSLVCGGGDGNELYFKLALLEFTQKREEFVRDPKMQFNVIWRIISSEIHEVLPSECALLQQGGQRRCSIYSGLKGETGLMYFVGDWIQDFQSVPRTVEALIQVMEDLNKAAVLEELGQ